MGCEPLADPEFTAGGENTQPRGPQRKSLTDTQDYGTGLKGRHGDGEGSGLMVKCPLAGLAPGGVGNVGIQRAAVPIGQSSGQPPTLDPP